MSNNDRSVYLLFDLIGVHRLLCFEDALSFLRRTEATRRVSDLIISDWIGCKKDCNSLSQDFPAVEEGRRVHVAGVHKLVERHWQLHRDLLLCAAVTANATNFR